MSSRHSFLSLRLKRAFIALWLLGWACLLPHARAEYFSTPGISFVSSGVTGATVKEWWQEVKEGGTSSSSPWVQYGPVVMHHNIEGSVKEIALGAIVREGLFTRRLVERSSSNNGATWGGISPGLVVQATAYTPPAPSITSSLTASGEVGTPFVYAITATGSPTSYGSSGVLPAGVDFNSSSGTFTGTPTEPGTFEVLISATNAGGTDTKTLTITISGEPCAGLTDPPEGYFNQHVIDVTLENSTEQHKRYRISCYRVTFERWGQNGVGDCVPIFSSGGRVSGPEEYDVPPGAKFMVHLEHGFPFEYEIEELVITATPDGGGYQNVWEPVDAPTESWGEHAPTRGRSLAVPGTTGDNQSTDQSVGPPQITPEAAPAPPAAEERPSVVSDHDTANQAAEARHKESQGALGSIAEAVTKLLNQSKSHAAQDAANDKKQEQRDNKSQTTLDGILGKLGGGGHEAGGAGEAGSGHGPAGEGGENIPGEGSGKGGAGAYGAVNPGSRLGVGSGQTAPMFVIPFGSLGISGLHDFPVDFADPRFADWVEGVRAMLLAAIALMMLLAAFDMVVRG